MLCFCPNLWHIGPELIFILDVLSRSLPDSIKMRLSSVPIYDLYVLVLDKFMM